MALQAALIMHENLVLLYITTPELLAIRLRLSAWYHILLLSQHTGHKSAASFPTGPVIAEPFISPFGFTI